MNITNMLPCAMAIYFLAYFASVGLAITLSAAAGRGACLAFDDFVFCAVVALVFAGIASFIACGGESHEL